MKDPDGFYHREIKKMGQSYFDSLYLLAADFVVDVRYTNKHNFEIRSRYSLTFQ